MATAWAHGDARNDLARGHQGAITATAEPLVEGGDQTDGQDAPGVVAELAASGEEGHQTHGQDDDGDQERKPLGRDLDGQHDRHDGPYRAQESQQAEVRRAAGLVRRSILPSR